MPRPKSERTIAIEQMPLDWSPDQVNEALKKRGLEPVTNGQIHNVRRTMREKGATNGAAKTNGHALAKRQPSQKKRPADVATDHERSFIYALLHLGFDRGQELLENFKATTLKHLQ